MSRFLVALVLLAAALATTPAAQQDSASAKATADGSAEWVARQVRDRNTGRDSRAEMRMRLFDRQGRVRERVLTMFRMRGEKGKGDRALIRFTYPNDIRNTSFLVWEHPDADDERFLYLPALGRVRRIAGQEKDQSFVGSDLSYEDIGGRDIADYTYAFVASDASWIGPDDTRHPAWLLESRAKEANAGWSCRSASAKHGRLAGQPRQSVSGALVWCRHLRRVDD